MSDGRDRPRDRNRIVGYRAALFGLAMLGLAFASVPLYRIFCQVTGFGGTTMRADAAPGAVAGQIGVRFDANINGALPWTFKPGRRRSRSIPARAPPSITNRPIWPDKPTTGRAVFNVSPTQAGAYFSKIECFCFTEQTLKAGEKVQDAGGVLRRSQDPHRSGDHATSTKLP